MIVKVQVAQMGHGKGRLLLIYDEERTFTLQCESRDVLRLMKGRAKAYFHSEIVGKNVQINHEAKGQDW